MQWSLRLCPDSQASRGGLSGMVGGSKVSSFILAAPCQGRGPPPRAAHFLLLTISLEKLELSLQKLSVLFIELLLELKM